MQIVVIADGVTQKEFQDKPIPTGATVQFVTKLEEAKSEADAYFYLLEEDRLVDDLQNIESKGSIFFVNAVATTLDNLPSNCVRICGWRGFLLQSSIEICTRETSVEKVRDILEQLQWQFHEVPDIVGMIAPRTTALIINEAYLVLEREATRKKQIDDAIKLTTNYSSGPFELAEKIGLRKIYALLEHLSAEENRFTSASLLKKEIANLGADS